MLDEISGSSIFILAILTSFLLAFPVISILYRFGIVRMGDVDFSNLIEERKKKVGTPIMGGLIVVITVLCLNLIFNLGHLFESSVNISLLIFVISALLGAFDDVLNIYGRPRKVERIHRVLKLIRVHKSLLRRIVYLAKLPWLIYKRIFFLLGSNPGKGIQAHEKVVVQVITGAILGLWIVFGQGGIHSTELWVPVLGFFDLGFLFVPFVVFTVVAMTNAVNLSDGMDGLAAGLLMSAFGGFLLISIDQGNDANTFLILTIMGSLLTYLYFNAPPARFQMGDVGSLSLGTILASIAFSLNVPILLLVIGFPFVAEVGSSILQGIGRRVLGRRILLMAPLHHHFEMKGWSEEKVVIRFWLFGIVCAVFGVWIYYLVGSN